MDVLLITRFSLALKMRTPKLFDIQRLRFRLEIFKTITLPSILNQSYKNFKWIILYDRLLPTAIFKELEKITCDHDFIVLKKYGKWNLESLTPYNEYLTQKYVLTLRIDDDDAITRKFIERVVYNAEKNKNDFLLITHPNGLYWSYSKCLNSGYIFSKKYHFIAIGLGLLVNREILPITIYFHDHSALKRSLQTISINNRNNSIYQTFIRYKVSSIVINKILSQSIHIIIENSYSYIRTFHNNNDNYNNKNFKYHLKKSANMGIFRFVSRNFGISLESFIGLNKMIKNSI